MEKAKSKPIDEQVFYDLFDAVLAAANAVMTQHDYVMFLRDCAEKCEAEIEEAKED